MAITVTVHYPWAWVWIPPEHAVLSTDPDVEDGTSRGYKQSANRWDLIAETVCAAVQQAQHTPPTNTWDTSRSVQLDTDLSDSELQIVRSWVAGGDANVRLVPEADMELVDAPQTRRRWWNWRPQPDIESGFRDVLSLRIANGRHRLKAIHESGNEAALPMVDESFTYLPGAAPFRENYSFLFDPKEWDAKLHEWELAPSNIKTLNPTFYANLGLLAKGADKVSFRDPD